MAKTRKKKAAPEETDEDFPGGEPPTPVRDDPYGLAAKTAKAKRWKPAAEVLDKITAVSTVFVDFNRATKVGGLPVRRIHVVHGPSAGGKSVFIFGLIKSFLDAGFMAAYVDAEHAAGSKFANETIGDLADYPGFVASRPANYEETIEDVDEFLAMAAEVKAKHPTFKSIAVVDSINKLVPKRELKKMLKGGKVDAKGADEMTKGHHGRYRAALNQAWLDHLTPKLAAADCALVIIAQERDDHDDDFGDAFKVKGGAALIFDSSLVIRVMKSRPVFRSSSKEDMKNEGIIGFKHRVRIWKSKVGHMEGRYTDCVFHLSNGKLTPAGLDLARDAVLLGKELGIIKASGSWLSWGRIRAQGENKMVVKISKSDGLHAKLVDEINTKLRKAAS